MQRMGMGILVLPLKRIEVEDRVLFNRDVEDGVLVLVYEPDVSLSPLPLRSR